MTSKNMTMMTSLINRWTARIYEQQELAIKKKKKKQWLEKKLASREPKLVSIAQPKEPCEGSPPPSCHVKKELGKRSFLNVLKKKKKRKKELKTNLQK